MAKGLIVRSLGGFSLGLLITRGLGAAAVVAAATRLYVQVGDGMRGFRRDQRFTHGGG